jgi:hypothetical protein
MATPRLDTFLRITPGAYEREFWRSSQQHRRLATFLDWWQAWFTITNCVLVLRYLKINRGTLVESHVYRFWCSLLLVTALAQTAWRLAAPSHYSRCRLRVLLLNR